MTETTNLQQDNQGMQRDNYGLVESHQRPETDKDSRECSCCRCCLCCCLKFLRCLIGCLEVCVRCFRKYCCLICCCIYRWCCCPCCSCCHCCRCCQRNVQIVIPVQTPTTIAFSSAISNVCKKIAYTCQLYDNVGMLKKELPLVVVCQIEYRYEPDIDGALREIKWKSPFVVLCLHSGLESSLPKLPTADKLANKEKYQNVKFIDVAYNTDAKLYQCEMNKTARRQLETFLNDLKHNKFINNVQKL